jgi:hypothetical protein
MKTLIPSDKTGTGISLYLEDDGKNFTVGKGVHGESKGKPTFKIDKPAYHGSNFIKALEDMAHREATHGCEDIKSYITIHRQSLDLFRAEVKDALGLK